MNIVFTLLKWISSLITIYTIIVFLRVLITWIPSFEYSQAGRILAEICDPYLNLFKKVRWLQKGSLDFTPILAMAALILASSLLNQIAVTRHFSVGIVLALVVQLFWSLAHSLLSILIIIIAIRLIFSLLNRDTGSNVWTAVDRFISPLAYRVCKVFFPGKYIKYQTVLVWALVASILALVLGGLLMGLLAGALEALPF